MSCVHESLLDAGTEGSRYEYLYDKLLLSPYSCHSHSSRLVSPLNASLPPFRLQPSEGQLLNCYE